MTIRDIDVTVRQIIETTAVSLEDPELLQVIVALHRQVEDSQLAGEYANAETDFLFPGLLSTSTLDSSSVQVEIVNEFGTQEISLGSLATLKEGEINVDETGVTLPDYLRWDRVSQALSTTGSLAVDDTTVLQTVGTAVCTVAGSNIDVTGLLAVTNSVAAGDILELEDVNNANQLRRFRISVAVDEDTLTLESLDPDGVGDLASGSHENIRVFTPVYTLTDINAKFLKNRTRPVDDGLPSGSKTYPQVGETLPVNFSGLYAFIGYDPLVGSDQTWRIKTWSSETAVILDPVPISGVSAGPPMTATASVRYSVTTEEPAIGRYPNATADVKLTFIALRTDKEGQAIKVATPTEAETELGPAVLDNPAGLAAFIATSINNGLRVMVIPISTDDAVGHAKAIETLATLEGPYYICPVTQVTGVNSLYVAHVDLQSQPENRRPRVCLLNSEIPDRTVYQDLGSPGTVDVTAGAPSTIEIPGATFLTLGVNPGDLVELKDAGIVGTPLRQFVITHVVNETKVEVSSLNPDSLGALADGNHTEVKIVTDNYTAEEKKDQVKSVALAYNDRRVRYIQPDSGTLPLSSVSTTIPGGYFGVFIGAMYAGRTPGLPISNEEIPLLTSVIGSDSQWSDAQLRELTGAGVFLLIQPTTLSSPIIRHQVSTDVSNGKVQEASFTHLVDSLEYALRYALRPQLGNQLLTKEFERKAHVIVHTVCHTFEDVKKLITGFTIRDIKQVVEIPNALYINLQVDVPGVANNIDLDLFV